MAEPTEPVSINARADGCSILIIAPDYDLAATLDSGQAFRWQRDGPGWTGIVDRRWVRLEQRGTQLFAIAAHPGRDWSWLTNYLQTSVSLAPVLAAFPDDPPMRAAVGACRGLRLLRQDPWECLASFLLSSTKQISQIRQIVARLCERFGEPVAAPAGQPRAFAFPSAQTLAEAGVEDLRDCKMGFRAPNLRAAAKAVARGELNLKRIGELDLKEARTQLMKLPGVGPKIADCVLLFAYEFPAAFPVDVWVLRALRELYFAGHQPRLRELREFAATHFGQYAGWAQQYLFHYMRMHRGRPNTGRESLPIRAPKLPSPSLPMPEAAVA